MKKILSVIICALCAVCSAWAMSGSGTSLDPYKISTASDLQEFAQEVNNGNTSACAILEADIDLSYIEEGDKGKQVTERTEWTPIGTHTLYKDPYSSYYNKYLNFNGSFDGRNHYIRNFKVSNTNNYAGLFGYVENADIRNIKVENATVNGYYAGIICGYAESSTIVACDNYANVSSTSSYVGGICGYLSNSTISNCLNAGTVKGSQYVGGVAGYLQSSTVESCVNQKSVQSSGQYTGGVAGYIGGSNSVIQNCSSSSDATVSGNAYTGGICGNVSGGASISYCTNEGAVIGGNQEVGGVIGHLDSSSALQLFNYGSVSSTSSQVGGVIGSSENSSTVTSCANAGYVTATNDRNVGGVIGNSAATTMNGCVNTGVVRGSDYTGGIAGYFFENSAMNKCVNYGPVSGSDYVGGLTGEARAPMAESLSTGYVQGSGTHVGAISGSLFQTRYASACLYDNQLCPLDKAFGQGNGDGEGDETQNLTGASVDGFDATDWTMAAGMYPRVSNLATEDFSVAGATAMYFANGDDADNFGNDATLTTANRVKWSSKGGTAISGSVATPAVKGQDTIFVNKTNATKAIPVRVTNSNVTTYTLNITAGVGGEVNQEVNGEYIEGQDVTIEATPHSGYSFKQWSDGNANAERTVTMTRDITLEAQFEQIPTYTLTITAGEGGTVNDEEVNGSYEVGTKVTIVATPEEKYLFKQWSDGDKNETRIVTMNSNITLEAQFEKIPATTYRLEVKTSVGDADQTAITLKINGQEQRAQANGSYDLQVEEDATVSLTAYSPDDSYNFLDWMVEPTITYSEDGNTIEFTMKEAVSITANFEYIVRYYDIVVMGNQNGSVWSDVLTEEADVNEKGGNTYSATLEGGTEFAINATPIEGYIFEHWDVHLVKYNGTEENYSISDQSARLTAKGDMTIEAVFRELETYEIFFGTTVGGDIVLLDDYKALKDGTSLVNMKIVMTENQTIKIGVSVEQGYQFLRWSDGVKNKERTYVPTKNAVVYPIFKVVECVHE